MSIFATKAQVVASGLSTVEGLDLATVGSSPFLTFLQQLLASLLPMLTSCIPAGQPAGSTPTQLLTEAKNLTPIQRWMLRRQIRMAIDDQEGSVLLTAPIDRQIRAMIQHCTEADIAEAFAQSS
jgi:hypothetical protein